MNTQAQFFEKLKQRSGRTKTVRSTFGSEATRPQAGTQQRSLFPDDSLPENQLPSAEEQWYQRTCDELPPDQRKRFIRLVQQLAAKG